MKAKMTLAAIAIAAGFSAMSASAADGTISFTGEISASTCEVSGASGAVDVTLPTVGLTSLKAAGDTAGATPFSISVTNCAMGGKTYAYFEAGANTNSQGRLDSTGSATGVEVEILNKDETPINVGGAGDQGVAKVDVDASGDATLQYLARYYATAAAGAGNVATSVQYSVIYE
ncbi:hypothetical protein BJP62_05925 [Jeongeupia sp. USM3]|nr:hypothetical protein BJP62_05925 [Jeongeupia sp. USM3]